jgi:ubiquitin C-terminal hydrolase
MITCLGNFIPKYKQLQQQDSHEFLLNTLDLLHKGLSYQINVEINGHVITEADRLMKVSYERWSKFYENSYSYVVQCFGGMMYSKIKCMNCPFEEDVFEPFNCLSLEIEWASLDESLQNHFNENEIVNEWKCERCKGNGCSKNTKLWSLPNYLIIHLKRFTNNGSKITSDVRYPLDDLNLTHLISPQKEDPNKYIYSLYSVNCHSGSATSGHYWSTCKNLDESWYSFNDGNVSRQNVASDTASKDAYILFYSRKFIPNIGLSIQASTVQTFP